MELVTISEVSRSFQVTTRTLRYYEQLGLIESTKKEGYAYRTYDDLSLQRLRQIMILRKLGVPLRQVATILDHEDAVVAIDIFKERVEQAASRIESLTTIKEIMMKLIEELERNNVLQIKPDIWCDEALLHEIESLSLTCLDLKEEKSMKDLNKAAEQLQVLDNVRIVHVPPGTVAASHYEGENPEEHAGNQLAEFLQRSQLYSIKPDARVFGFNHPNPSHERPYYGYELWVTIPEDMEVPAPLLKKQYSGGLYAAHTITLGNFHEWKLLSDWVCQDNPKYEPDLLADNGEFMGGSLEEHLNYVYHCHLNWPESDEHQLDLLFPVKLKNS
ncbi:effector binding domain-containing protein [Paenibacillus sp. HN-1]|uniref:MerR family transcriptional regulator n=1 Tax=Paenibacillus TaxID=44249 RepID=UPI001CAA1EBC|nr:MULTISPECIES: effector binding domain-containing protein [Paenibacillus]MBY9078798.1 effector binding domain-containing protein [Paenibacillus sp. CGMCC 1.18879]MBY9088042.1 effector binding domain-containing protein [Paenibacillus sinensis]